MTISELRNEYRKLRFISEQWASREEWDAAVRAILPQNPTPADWVRAAQHAVTTCSKCGGNGIFYGQITVADMPVVTEGMCYQCKGTGKTGQDDYKRCYGFWSHYVPPSS